MVTSLVYKPKLLVTTLVNRSVLFLRPRFETKASENNLPSNVSPENSGTALISIILTSKSPYLFFFKLQLIVCVTVIESYELNYDILHHDKIQQDVCRVQIEVA